MLAEPVPLLSELSAPAVRRFLALWTDYLIRNEGLAPVMPTLKNAISAACQRHLMLLRRGANLVDAGENRTPPPGNTSTVDFEDENSVASSTPTIPEAARRRPVDWSSDADIKSQLIKQFGPRSFAASLLIQSKVVMKSSVVSDLAAMEYVEDWMEAMEWCCEYHLESKALVRSFLQGIKPRSLSQELRAQEHPSFEAAKVAFITRVSEYVLSAETFSMFSDASGISARSSEKQSNRNWRALSTNSRVNPTPVSQNPAVWQFCD